MNAVAASTHASFPSITFMPAAWRVNDVPVVEETLQLVQRSNYAIIPAWATDRVTCSPTTCGIPTTMNIIIFAQAILDRQGDVLVDIM